MMKKEVVVVVGAGFIGQAIARRVGAGKHLVVAHLTQAHSEEASAVPATDHMMEACAVGRAGTPDEVANVAALLMGPDGSFITGSDFLMDGGVTAAYRFGALAPVA